MKIGLIFVNAGPFAEPTAFKHLVTGAEANGFESLWSVEHVVIPDGFKSAYPYTSSGRLDTTGDVSLADPLMHLAFTASITFTRTQIRHREVSDFAAAQSTIRGWRRGCQPGPVIRWTNVLAWDPEVDGWPRNWRFAARLEKARPDVPTRLSSLSGRSGAKTCRASTASALQFQGGAEFPQAGPAGRGSDSRRWSLPGGGASGGEIR